MRSAAARRRAACRRPARRRAAWRRPARRLAEWCRPERRRDAWRRPSRRRTAWRFPGVAARVLGALALAFLACVVPRVARATTATVGADGNLHLDGAAFFPVGIYHVSWIGDRQGGEAVPDLLRAADAGFNLFHPTIDARDSTAELLDAAAARGVWVIGEIPWPASGPDDFVNEWKAYPALIGWNVADDFNAPYAGPAYNHPPAQVAARSATIASLAPQHVSYASGGSYPGYRIAEFAGTMGVMGFQSYPIGAGNHPDDYALEENAESFAWVRDQLAGTGQLFVANPQAYRWSGSRYPTPREARNLLYAPLLYGAKGVVWYAMWEGNGTLLPSVVPGLWDELTRLNAEVKSLTTFLLHGTRSELATGSARVHAASWQLDGQVLVVVVGTERAGSHGVTLALPPGADGPAHVVFPTRAESGMTVAGGMLAGTIGPEDVHVYLVDLPVAGDAAPTAAFEVVPTNVAFGEPATLDATPSADADGTVVDWRWDFGDGTQGTGALTSHAWAKPGTYPVRLTVRDDDGAPATTIVPVRVGVTSRCAPTPAAGCRTAGTSTLTIRASAVASKRRLDWSWKKGATSLSELGDPTSTTEVALCVYDANGLALATGVRPGATWQAVGTKGFRLRDASGGPGGLVKATLKPGTSATLLVKGKGALLPALALPLTVPVTAQLATSDGACWQGTYAGPKTVSTAEMFKGR